ncbi:hypothetical protein DEU56DRAFT_776393 [Suillus clintonianus]|uniref:uncharacterized protein n=1 Tax=Suillus clintonianus TaxID=1904413 RepID=UPI001B8603B2|nr:uncharacterized protein DEU56DRAFT_776393 [Suillus clintonianus]KAG2152819.1 hypothetical protein DEU56DRAFT_776393 [Suillus clintonianus]
MSEQVFVDIDALVNELQKYPLPTETDAYFTEFEPGRAFLREQLYAVFNGFLSQFFTPDATTFVSTCDSLIPLLDLALLTAENRKLVLDILELADVMFDKFVSVSLTLQQSCDPLSVVPTHSIIRTRLLDLIDQCLAPPHYFSDIGSELQTLKSKIQEREDQAKAALFACDTQWIYDLWDSCPEFKALDSWLSEDIPALALEIVAQGCTSTVPTSNEVSMLSPSTTAQLRRNSSIILENLRASNLGASQYLSALPTSVSRPIKGLPKRGASFSRTQSLSAMLPPQAQARVLDALGTVAEMEEE